MFLMHFKKSFQRLLTLSELLTEGEIDSTIFKNNPKNLNIEPSKILRINKNLSKTSSILMIMT